MSINFKLSRIFLGYVYIKMSSELLQQFRKDVINLRKCAKELDLSDREVDQIFKDCYKRLDQNYWPSQTHKHSAQSYFRTLAKFAWFFTILVIVVYVLLNVHQPTSSIVLRNVQGLIYPGMKALRALSVPIITKFPSLTNLYDESCLVENPYFYVSDMECWPCENVHSVIDLTGFTNHSSYQTGTPYIVLTSQEVVSFNKLQHLYLANSDLFDKEANNVRSTPNSPIKTLPDLFHASSLLKTEHVVWRINKMIPGRLLRTLFPRPHIVSEWSGQSIERFVMIDGPKAGSYAFPNPECGYVFVIQGSGERTVILRPSRECGDKCRTVSVILKAKYVLWYNWWYWRPISLPSGNATTGTSISYINSYC